MLEEQRVFGELPAYDYGTYTFLASLNPYVGHGDGMEHRNSTCITSNMPISALQLGTFAHEFFHCWNVERIRPADLEPFDFTQSNISAGLWLAEGFTQYYGNMMLVRAGLITPDFFAMNLGQWVNAKNATPAGRLYSPVDMSRYAVFADAATAIDISNKANVFTSYYTYGAAIALALDLELRAGFGTSLDALMKKLWVQFGSKGIPYQLKDIQQQLAAISSSDFAGTFFERYVFGHEPYNYEPMLKPYGFLYGSQKANWIGDISAADGASTAGLMLKNPAIKGSPLYEAGIDMDDIILSVDSEKIRSSAELNQLMARHQAGDQLTVEFLHRGETKKAAVTVALNPRENIVSASNQTGGLTPAEEKQRKQWLGSAAQ